MGRVAVVLSGCGHLDGSEIHESVLCLLHLENQGHFYQCFAPDVEQKKVVNHLNEEKLDETRNVLTESARIARGKIKPLSEIKAYDFDALLIPGGFGAALNLSTFAEGGEDFEVLEDLHNAIEEFHNLKKSIGATCIATIIIAKVFQGKKRLKLTLGTDAKFIKVLENLNMDPVPASVDESVADIENKIYTTPCYMQPDDLKGLSEGIEKMIKELVI